MGVGWAVALSWRLKVDFQQEFTGGWKGAALGSFPARSVLRGGRIHNHTVSQFHWCQSSLRPHPLGSIGHTKRDPAKVCRAAGSWLQCGGGREGGIVKFPAGQRWESAEGNNQALAGLSFLSWLLWRRIGRASSFQGRGMCLVQLQKENDRQFAPCSPG